MLLQRRATEFKSPMQHIMSFWNVLGGSFVLVSFLHLNLVSLLGAVRITELQAAGFTLQQRERALAYCYTFVSYGHFHQT
ncbi:hypothetical protein AOLI_G00259150 [Acnodon oligacanthus]